MGKRRKKKEKKDNSRTREEREEIVEKIKKDLIDNFGLHRGSSGAINELYEVMDRFVESGIAESGKIDFWEAPYGGRDILYIFTNNRLKECKLAMPLKN